jgi:hypothetical protein
MRKIFFPLPRSGDGLERGRPARLCALGNQTSLDGTPRRFGEHAPNRLGVQFGLFWCFYAQRRAGRPRSSPNFRYAEIFFSTSATRKIFFPLPLRVNFFLSVLCEFLGQI